MYTLNTAMDESRVQFAADAIAAYLLTYPNSADTLEGIHLWWIQWPGMPESLVVTMAALERLKQAGLIEAHAVGNKEVWRNHRAKAE